MLFRCKRCLYPNTKPDLHFSSEGLCSACIAFDARKDVDWKQRQAEFLDTVRRHPGSTHDVIVAVSGGKDSHWQVIKCRELGLRPLAVCATTDHLSPIGRRNLDNIAELCDLVEVTVHKPTRRRIAKLALTEVGDISWCEHHLIWSVPARESVARGIPIVLYGECPQNEYGAGPPGSAGDRMSKAWVDEFGGLLGLRLADVADMLAIDPKRLEPYRYPVADADKVHALWMGSYFEWDGQQNAKQAGAYGFRTWPLKHGPVEGTPTDYENLDNYQTGIHDYLRWLKFGYGRTCDIASNWIRRGRIVRGRGAQLCLEHDGKWPATYLRKSCVTILRQIGVTMPEFDAICERFTDAEVVRWASKPESFEAFMGSARAA